MPFYLTRNPVPSADMRDVFDNAQNLDLALNNITSAIWTDRFGRSRMSWYGLESAFSLKLTDFETSFTAQLSEQANEFEAAQAAHEDSFQQFLLNSGYEYLADYVDGPITFTRRNQITAYNGEFYRPKASVSLPYTTTGNTATTWETDKDNFVAVGGAALRQELISTIPLSPEISLTTRSQFDASYSGYSWGVAGISFGGDNNRANITVDDKGRIKVSSSYNGLQVSSGVMFPTVHNTGRVIRTALGTYPQKIVRFPSDQYESDNTSPALGFSYSADGKPTLTLISPTQYAAGNSGFPEEGSSTLNVMSIPVALGTDIASQIEYNAIPQNSYQQYVMVAKWKVSSTPWNTELKMLTTSSNTTDNFIGTVTVEANIQSSGTLFSTTSNLTQINLSKYLKVKFDGLRDRVPLNSATTATIPRYGCTSDGTYLYLWLVIPGGQSSVKNILIHQGTGTAVTYTPGSDNLTTSLPSGLVYIPVISDFNGENSSVANDGSIIAADSHVRICGTSGTSTRADITKDGFIWGGYGTYKSFRESCVISRSGTGTYVVTGPHQSYDWNIRQPVDTNGQQVAIAMVTSTASSGYSVTVSVYSIKYTYDSSTGAVTRGIGDLMDIPSGTWVDLKGSTTF